MICRPICAGICVMSRSNDRLIPAVVRACCRSVCHESNQNLLLCHVRLANNCLFSRSFSHTSSSWSKRHRLFTFRVGHVNCSSSLNSWLTVHGSRQMTCLSRLPASGESIGCSRTGLENTHGHRVNWMVIALSRFMPIWLSSRRWMVRLPSGVWTGNNCDGLVALHSVQPVRHKSRSGSGSSKASNSDQESDEEELDDDDYEAPLNFKKMKIYLKSLRADSVISSALDISRNRVDETFFGSRLRLNGEKLLKKSKQMGEGDYVEVVMERATDEDQLLVKRVKVIAISEDRTNKDKLAVTVKVWKSAFPVPDTSKSQWK